MPSEKSARVSLRKARNNRNVRSAIKTHITAARRAASAGKAEEAQTEGLKATSALDRAAKQGVVHPNNAARRKSRLAKSMPH